MSRVTKRSNTKSNRCPKCPNLSFRGKGKGRLAQHMAEVHGPERGKG